MDNCKAYNVLRKDWVERYGVKNGTKVRFLRKFELGEMGNELSWASDMGKMLGQECKVLEVDTSGGISIKKPGETSWWVPFYCLEFISNPKPEIEARFFCGNEDVTGELSRSSKRNLHKRLSEGD